MSLEKTTCKRCKKIYVTQTPFTHCMSCRSEIRREIKHNPSGKAKRIYQRHVSNLSHHRVIQTQLI